MLAVHRGSSHTFSKRAEDEITLVKGGATSRATLNPGLWRPCNREDTMVVHLLTHPRHELPFAANKVARCP